MKRGWEDLGLRERVALRYLSNGEPTANGCPFCEQSTWTVGEVLGNSQRFHDWDERTEKVVSAVVEKMTTALLGKAFPTIHMCWPMYGKLGEALWHAIGLEDEQFRALDWSTLIAVIVNTDPNPHLTVPTDHVAGEHWHWTFRTTRNLAITRYMQTRLRLVSQSS
jgi:hypothetical protein